MLISVNIFFNHAVANVTNWGILWFLCTRWSEVNISRVFMDLFDFPLSCDVKCCTKWNSFIYAFCNQLLNTSAPSWCSREYDRCPHICANRCCEVRTRAPFHLFMFLRMPVYSPLRHVCYEDAELRGHAKAQLCACNTELTDPWFLTSSALLSLKLNQRTKIALLISLNKSRQKLNCNYNHHYHPYKPEGHRFESQW
jgi:hypothetical protein